jgi:hypothetical protein
MHKTFIFYATQTARPAKARDSAEIVLGKEPEYVPALAVRMMSLKTAGQLDEARKIARRINELDQDSSSDPRRLAAEVLKTTTTDTRPWIFRLE